MSFELFTIEYENLYKNGNATNLLSKGSAAVTERKISTKPAAAR